MRRDGPGSFLLLVAVLLGVTFYGPMLAQKFVTNVHQMLVILAPVGGTLIAIVIGVLVFRFYWSRY